ncbi:MAG: hypothetical protein RL693_1933, partial [Verrucomicrobiota bacterium]
MNATSTLGVIQDLFLLAGLVLLAGMGVYAVIRSQTNDDWNYEGNVLTRPYGVPDAFIALGVIVLFGWSALQITDPEKAVTAAPQALSPAIELLLGISLLMFFSILLILYMRICREMDPAEMFGLRSLPIPVALGIATLSFLAVWVA